MRAEWRFVPSAQLGGDAFGYYWLDPSTFVFYLVDVSGHGVGSAMHSVSVLNVLRQRALPERGFQESGGSAGQPERQVPADSHGGLYFTMWYGVYRTDDRDAVLRLRRVTARRFSCRPDKSETQPLGMSALMIGMLPDQTYDVQQTTVPPGSTLFVFSDGAYEIVTKEEERWEL